LHGGGVVRAEVINGRIVAAVGRAAARLAVHVASALDGDPAEAAFLLPPARCRGNGRSGMMLRRPRGRPVGSRCRTR
jgi:hypothetical protein